MLWLQDGEPRAPPVSTEEQTLMSFVSAFRPLSNRQAQWHWLLTYVCFFNPQVQYCCERHQTEDWPAHKKGKTTSAHVQEVVWALSLSGESVQVDTSTPVSGVGLNYLVVVVGGILTHF